MLIVVMGRAGLDVKAATSSKLCICRMARPHINPLKIVPRGISCSQAVWLVCWWSGVRTKPVLVS